MGNTAGRAGGVQSVDRAISVLEILARKGEAGVTEVAAEIAVHKSTAFRLLGALENRGLVEQSAQRGKYRLGFGLIPLAGAVTDNLDVTRQGRAVCAELAAEVGETVNVAVLQEHWAVNVDQARGPSTVATHNWIGKLTPLHCTASGKVLLAAVGPAQRSALLAASGVPRHTPRTIVDRARLEAELARVVQRGCATAVEEYEVGLNALAAPVLDRSGEVIAAVSVSGPSYRLDERRLEACLEPLLAATKEISRRMGWFAG
ncbi:transcriptional regulator, IclR family [Pseudonocardia thermophila]|jgi:Transcriptional regulator|uniref:Glycerol operon regulatory protein n=1 Tax=Pseudonocardia thermophila TaxID=1848 RepID=A0A1M6Q6N1_PSETH|nr:IclR family transcriptional regulator [Pseudonocardia thermophila]SHK15861.1 transcriptional regulator, IclR family [Pseudonocardia thermophila]